MRILWKIFIGLLSTIIAIIVIADLFIFFWLQSNPDKVRKYVAGQTGNKVDIGSVGGELIFGFHATDLVVFPSENPLHQKLLRASSVRFRPSVSSLVKRKPFPSSVQLDDFDTFLTINEKGELVLPAFSRYANQGGIVTKPLDLPCDVVVQFSRGSIYLNWYAPGIPAAQAGLSEVHGKGRLMKSGQIIVDDIRGVPAFGSKELRASGNIDPFAAKSLDINVSGEGINLFGFSASLSPLFAGIPDSMLPTGTAAADIRISGPFDNITLEGNLKLTSGKLASMKITSGDLPFSYSDKTLKVNNGTINCYGGTINLDGELMLAKGPAYRFYTKFSNLDVNAYLEEIHLYFQEAGGAYKGQFDGYGKLSDPDSFIATGHFTSANGTYLSPFPTYATGLPDMLGYKVLRVEFDIARGVIAISSLLLDSDILGVVGTGTIDRQHELDMKGQMRFPRSIAYAVPSLKKWAPVLPTNKEDKVVVNFTLKGDITHPKFEPVLPNNIFEGFLTGDMNILENAKDFFGNFFK